MARIAALLRDGLRLATLRAPRATPLDTGFGQWLAAALLGAALDLALQWPLFDAPRELSSWGAQSALAAALLRLGTSALLCALTARRALFWTVATWIEVAMLPISAAVGAVYVAAEGQGPALYALAYRLGVFWLLLVLLRLAAFLHPREVARAFGAAVLGVALIAAPWLWMDPAPWWYTRVDRDAFVDEIVTEPGAIDAPEATMYAQPERLQQALDALAPQRPGRIDLYAVAFGGDAGEDVFRNEVEYFARLMPQRFDAERRTLALLNHPATVDTRPLASATNLERALHAIGTHMDPAQDILFLYLTSHGSEDHELLVNQPPLPLDQLTPGRLRGALDASGIRWRVLVVSACYSGGFVDALRDPQTLVLTAARDDRTSFGCGADSDITWFGKAFLAEALNETVDFVAAFEQARQRVDEWEKKEDFEPSLPQIDQGERIAAQLQRWRDGFTPGPALAFAPAAKPATGTKRAETDRNRKPEVDEGSDEGVEDAARDARSEVDPQVERVDALDATPDTASRD